MTSKREWAVQFPNVIGGKYDRLMTIDPFTGRPFDENGAKRLVRTEKVAGENVPEYEPIAYRVVYRDLPDWEVLEDEDA